MGEDDTFDASGNDLGSDLEIAADHIRSLVSRQRVVELEVEDTLLLVASTVLPFRPPRHDFAVCIVGRDLRHGNGVEIFSSVTKTEK